MEMIIEELKNQIKLLDEKSSLIKVKNLSTITYYNNFIKHKAISRNYNFLEELDLKGLEDLLKGYVSHEEFLFLEFYQQSLKTSFFNLNSKDVKTLREPLEKIQRSLISMTAYLDNLEAEEKEKVASIEEMKSLKKSYKNIIDKISSSLALDETDFQLLYEISNKIDDRNNDINFLVSCGELLINNKNHKNNYLLFKDEEAVEDEIIMEVDNKYENETLLKNIFNKYHLDYDLLPSKAKEQLSRFATTNNVDNLLKVFDSYDINVGKMFNGESLLTTRGNQLALILINSNPTNLRDMLAFLDEHNLCQHNNQFNVNELLSRPSHFYAKKRRSYIKKHKISKEHHSKNENVIATGSLDDFIKNYQLFSSLGLSKDSFMKYDGYQDSLNRICQHCVNIYDQYHIPRDKYLSTVTAFNKRDPEVVLDFYLEHNLFDYVINNLSVVNRNIEEDERFLNIALVSRYCPSSPDTFYHEGTYHAKSNKQLEQMLLDSGYPQEQLISSLDNPVKVNADGKFSVYDKCLENSFRTSYLDTEIFEDEITQLLDKFYLKEGNDLVYDFGKIPFNIYEKTKGNIVTNFRQQKDLFISRPKFLRYYKALKESNQPIDIDALMYCLVKGSYLTTSEYQTIKFKVNTIMKKGRRL